jgi:hypothetical protein
MITSKYQERIRGMMKKIKEIRRWRFGVMASKGSQNLKREIPFPVD